MAQGTEDNGRLDEKQHRRQQNSKQNKRHIKHTAELKENVIAQNTN